LALAIGLPAAPAIADPAVTATAQTRVLLNMDSTLSVAARVSYSRHPSAQQKTWLDSAIPEGHNTGDTCLIGALFGLLPSLRRSASLRVALWLCAWLTPLVHQAQCTESQHAKTTGPIGQLATTAIIAAPPQHAPAPR